MSCRTIILVYMKKPLLIIFCLISFYGWSQTNMDSIRIEIDNLNTSKLAIQSKIDTLKNAIIARLLLEEQLRLRIDESLVEIDSLTAIQLKLQRKKQPTAKEQVQIDNLNKFINSSSTKLQEIDTELNTMINKRRNVIQQLQLGIDLINDLHSKIIELEEIIK